MSSPLFSDITEDLSRTWGGPVHIKEVLPLANRLSHTSRLVLEGKGAFPSTVIAKHVPEAAYPANRLVPEFSDEMDLYQCLDTWTPTVTYKAAYLGSSPKGYLLLEDLGEHTANHDMEQVSKALAQSFAELHAKTFGKETSWMTFQKQQGLDPAAAQKKDNSKAVYAQRFQQGVEAILGRIPRGASGDLKSFKEEAETIFETLQHPGKWTALVHHDVLNHRQCIEKDEGLYLIDFENAIFSHALLDVAKSIVGKYEYTLDGQECYRDHLFFTNPQFPGTLITDYRHSLEADHGIRATDREFKQAMEAALLFSGIALYGEVLSLCKSSKIYGTERDNLHWIFSRSTQFLEEPYAFPAMTRLLRATFLIQQ